MVLICLETAIHQILLTLLSDIRHQMHFIIHTPFYNEKFISYRFDIPTFVIFVL